MLLIYTTAITRGSGIQRYKKGGYCRNTAHSAAGSIPDVYPTLLSLTVTGDDSVSLVHPKPRVDPPLIHKPVLNNMLINIICLKVTYMTIVYIEYLTVICISVPAIYRTKSDLVYQGTLIKFD